MEVHSSTEPCLINSGKAAGSQAGVSHPPDSLAGIIEVILEVGAQRKSILVRMRAALESHQDVEALDLARELCGVDHEKSHSANSRVN